MRKSTMLVHLLVKTGKADDVEAGLLALRERFAHVFPAERFAEWDGIIEDPQACSYMESFRLPERSLQLQAA